VVIPGFLAQALGRVASSYSGVEAELASHALHIFAQVEDDKTSADDPFLRLYFDERLISSTSVAGGVRFTAYNPPGSQRRRPTPLEATFETCRRLRDLDALMRSLRALTLCGAVVGGSIGYGRFMNIRGANWAKTTSNHDGSGAQHVPLQPGKDPINTAQPQDASDMDLILVLDSYDDLDHLCECLGHVDGANTNRVDDLRERVSAFRRLDPPAPRMFSHKLPLWDTKRDPLLEASGLLGTYVLSLHIFSRSDFDFLLLRDQPILSFDNQNDHTVSMSDYRPDSPDKRFDQQRSFAGSELRLPRPFKDVELGFLAESAVCLVRDGRYHPGMYQNLLLPLFDTAWDDFAEPLTPQIDAFRWKIIERLRLEKQRWPNERVRLSLSHTRSELFAPHVAIGLDEGRIL